MRNAQVALPKLLDELVTRRIVDAVRAGASRTAAAEASRVGRSTLHLWLKRGASGEEEPYASFTAKVRQAEGELEKELLGIIKGHSANSWQAAAWILERKFQARWAIRKPREREAAPITPEETASLIAEAAQLHAETQEKK
jgi:transposase